MISMIRRVVRRASTRYLRETGQSWPRSIEVLEGYVGKPRVCVHFSDLNKLGINPQSKYDTPIGIYGYPLTRKVFDDFLRGTLPFAADRDWIHVFELKTQGLIELAPNGQSPDYNNRDFEKDVEILRQKYPKAFGPNPRETQRQWYIEAFHKSAFGVFWNTTRNVVLSLGGSPAVWNKVLREMGIQAIIDGGSGIVHKNEPLQALALSVKALTLLDSIPNRLGETAVKEHGPYAGDPEEVRLKRLSYEAWLKSNGAAIQREVLRLNTDSSVDNVRDVLLKLDRYVSEARKMSEGLPGIKTSWSDYLRKPFLHLKGFFKNLAEEPEYAAEFLAGLLSYPAVRQVIFELGLRRQIWRMVDNLWEDIPEGAYEERHLRKLDDIMRSWKGEALWDT